MRGRGARVPSGGVDLEAGVPIADAQEGACRLGVDDLDALWSQGTVDDSMPVGIVDRLRELADERDSGCQVEFGGARRQVGVQPLPIGDAFVDEGWARVGDRVVAWAVDAGMPQATDELVLALRGPFDAGAILGWRIARRRVDSYSGWLVERDVCRCPVLKPGPSPIRSPSS